MGFGFDDPEMQKYWRLHILAPELEPFFRGFVERVYREGLAKQIDDSRRRGMSGRFGKTTLRSWSMCGRVMLTFEYEGGQVTYLGRDLDNEVNRTFPEDVVEPGESFGLHSLEGDVFAARSALEDVVQWWPTVRVAKEAGFTDDDHTELDVIAAFGG